VLSGCRIDIHTTPTNYEFSSAFFFVNIASALPVEKQKKLHSLLLAAKNCKGKNGCRGVQMMNLENE
jgi:hypothetical protein